MTSGPTSTLKSFGSLGWEYFVTCDAFVQLNYRFSHASATRTTPGSFCFTSPVMLRLSIRILDVHLTSQTRSQVLNDNSKRGVVVHFMRPDEVGSMYPQLHASSHKETFIFFASRYIYPIVHFHFHFHFLRKTPTPRRNMTKEGYGTRE